MINAWTLVYEGYEPQQEGLREALCTLGNGYFATRGAGEEARPDDIHYPGVYIAGCYNRLESEVDGKTLENEDLVNLPNWLPISIRHPGGDWFDLDKADIFDYRQELSMRRGVLTRRYRMHDDDGRVTALSSERLVHMSQPHLAAIRMSIRPENWSGPLEVRSALDGRVENRGVARYRALCGKHIRPLASGNDASATYLVAETTQSHIRIALAARHVVDLGDSSNLIEVKRINEPDYVAQQYALDLKEGHAVQFEKICSLFTSRDLAVSEPALQAQSAVGRSAGFQELCKSHERDWTHLWELFDIVIDAEPGNSGPVGRALRLHTFHLLQTLSINSLDLDVGTPARGLHGEAYRGHVFWDELFVFPFFNLRMPEITRGLLKYRYRRLGEARLAAQALGYMGAMFPWQSASSGREESQKWHLNPKSGRWLPDNSDLQRHVNAAIAYNIWQYYQVTGDLEFLSFYGAEMFFEIARFWASLASYNPGLDRYEIEGVIGPDEYHDRYPEAEAPGVRNNAYTNVMASWVLWRAAQLADFLPADQFERLRGKLQLSDDEVRVWEKISRGIRVVFHRDGVISQFEGYENLTEFDWELYRLRYDDIHRLDRILEAEDDTPNRYKVSKQADVLMLFYLFSAEELEDIFTRLDYAFDPEIIPKTIDYYLNRTSHGSTLSRVVHSWVLSRADRSRSWSLFKQALDSDISDIQGGTTSEGIHLGAMAGTADILLRCYTGIETRGNVLWLNPRLPDEVGRLRMTLRYRQRRLTLEADHEQVRIEAQPGPGPTLRIGVVDEVRELGPGETCTYPIKPEPAAAKQIFLGAASH